MSAPEMWRLVDGRGGVREVPVRVEGGLLLVGPGPQPRYFASEEPPRLALMHYAMSMRWPIAEILAPGERTRSEALVMVERERDSARSDCGVMSHLHGERSEELIAAKRDLAAERARCAAVCREVAAEYEGHAGAVARQCAEAVERGPSAPGVG